MKFLLYTLVSLLTFSAVTPIVHAETPKENVIIIFKDDIDYKAVNGVNGEIEEVFNHVPVATGEVPLAAIKLLERDKDVLAVEVDQKVQAQGQVQDWGIQAVNAPTSWESEFTGKGIKIAVLDTGISPHEDLIVSGGVSFVSYTNSYDDDNGHGQHIGGIIGAENNNGIGTVGVAPDADVFAVKVLDQNGIGYLSDIIKGIDWSISNKMDIINLSLGAPNDSLALKQAVDKAYSQGILVVAASGNNGKADGTGDTVDYPARYDSVIAVSAIDQYNNRGSFSATGNTVEVTAPGVNVLSTYLNNSYAIMSGTSMAAPYVVGTLALLKQANPTLTNLQLREKLNETVVDLGTAGKDSFFGYGLVQAPVQAKSLTEELKTEPAPIQEALKQEPAPMEEAPKQEPAPNQEPFPFEKAPKRELVPIPETINEEQAPVSAPVQPPVKQPVKKPTKVAPKPVVKPALKKNMTTFITTTNSMYSAGKPVIINIKLVDKISKKPITNSLVKLTITSPKGKVKIVSLKTNSKGQATYKMTTSRYTMKGKYKFSTMTSLTNYNVAYASKSIRIK